MTVENSLFQKENPCLEKAEQLSCVKLSLSQMLVKGYGKAVFRAFRAVF